MKEIKSKLDNIIEYCRNIELMAEVLLEMRKDENRKEKARNDELKAMTAAYNELKIKYDKVVKELEMYSYSE